MMSTCARKCTTAKRKPSTSVLSTSSSLGISITAICCLIVCARSAYSISDNEIVSGDYCHAEVFHASCDDDDADDEEIDETDGPTKTAIATGSGSGMMRVIVIERAQYGRMELGRCVEVDLMGHLGCQTDVLGLVDRRCSGRRRCEIRVPDAELENTRPCLRELKTYLHIEYRCIAVEMVTADRCRTSNILPVSQPTSGYIASVVTSDTPWCADGRRPWLIQAETGQQISLTLYDFFSTNSSAVSPLPWQTSTAVPGDVNGATSNVRIRPIQKRNKTVAFVGYIEHSTTANPSIGGADDSTVFQTKPRCREYAIIQDGDGGEMKVLCGGTRRVNEVYKSSGNVVRIWIRAGIGPKDFQRFLIAYNVIGCADPALMSHTWFRRASNEHAISGCLASDIVWSMDCRNGTWQGPSHNCSPAVIPRDAGSTWRHSREDDAEQVKENEETELAIAAGEPALTATIATDHFVLIVVSGLVGTVVLLIAVSVLFVRLTTVAGRRQSPAPRRSPSRAVDRTADRVADDGCFKATANAANAEYHLSDGLKKQRKPETVVIADRHVSCWCKNSDHTVIPTTGRYHVRHQTEETTTTNSSILWRSIAADSRLQRPVPSVSGTVDADSKTNSLAPTINNAERVSFTKYDRTEWLLPVTVRDAQQRLPPDATMSIGRGGTHLPQIRLASSFTTSPV